MNTTDLARAAGVHPLAYSEEYLPGLERLVALVRADEREACAKVCDDYDVSEDVSMCDTAEGIAAAIRARSKE